ncbi:unnamed protein product [Danaus chrysippus]|uniref:(African queen) hypothetical protein n=1 Tax=Danaus chrysippus TaxID=151541 RepID=A0A8J2W5N2_9NEOP|nr:unnamed protein product [Danaus chrysippus]
MDEDGARGAREGRGERGRRGRGGEAEGRGGGGHAAVAALSPVCVCRASVVFIDVAAASVPRRSARLVGSRVCQSPVASRRPPVVTVVHGRQCAGGRGLRRSCTAARSCRECK